MKTIQGIGKQGVKVTLISAGKTRTRRIHSRHCRTRRESHIQSMVSDFYRSLCVRSHNIETTRKQMCETATARAER